jgi:hypothetical protein
VLVAAGCSADGQRTGRAVPTATTGPAASSDAIASTRAEIEAALAAVGLALEEPALPYRPGEVPELVRAPRRLFRAVLPDDPAHGFIVVYELPGEEAATEAAEAQAQFVNSGPGRVQFPLDAQFVIRRVGATVVFHVFSREVSSDRRAADVVVALQRLGVGVR